MFAWKYARSKDAFRDGRNEYYVSGLIWHAPWAYSSDRRAELNEAAWGGGFGRSVVDTNGNTHGIYALVFRASHFKPGYHAGYLWTTYWSLHARLQVGLGYTALFFVRPDLGYDVPTPAVLPVATLRYEKFELMGAWVPSFGSRGGNVGYLAGRFNY